MSRSLCNCLGPRGHGNTSITVKMRHWWNKIFFAIIRVMIFLNQLILMAPFIYSSMKTQRTANSVVITTTKCHYRTHRVVTGMAIVLCLTLSATAPVLVKMSVDLYDNTRKQQDNLFTIIARTTVAVDILCSLLIMAAQIWHRENLVQILNLFHDIRGKMCRFEKNIVSFKIFVTLLLKCGLTMYELLLSVPFLVTASSRLSTANIVSCVAILIMQHLSTIFALTLFVQILLVLTLSQQLEKQLRKFENISNNIKMLQLISLQNDLHKLITLFVTTTQIGTFIVILLNFVTILCNIYALLDYYVTSGFMYRTFIIYIAVIAGELYCLILVTYLCERSQRKVRDLFLTREEHYFFKPPSAFEIVDTSVLWPQRHEFCILGLFTLSNDFALFLLAYSINFIVIILEFEVFAEMAPNQKTEDEYYRKLHEEDVRIPQSLRNATHCNSVVVLSRGFLTHLTFLGTLFVFIYGVFYRGIEL